MNTINEYLNTITDEQHRLRCKEIFDWIHQEFPQLEEKIAWKQPMFLHEGTFIIGFSASQQHISISPEKTGISKFSMRINDAGYEHSSNLFRIKWKDEVDYALLNEIIIFQIEDKLHCPTFWRS